VVDVTPLVGGSGDPAVVGREIDAACRDQGFFSVVGHGVDQDLLDRVVALAREFFARPEDEKRRIAMRLGGRAWRGWFPIGGELTSGVPDRKEGIYFGRELDARDRRVALGLPLHGPNLFPERPPGMREAVLELMAALESLGHRIASGISLGLGLDADWFARHLTADPVTLFRIFRYPPLPPDADPSAPGWGVAEHTDYGLLTLLVQDGNGGLEVRTRDEWSEVDPVPGALVCNLGDMLERMTAGRYRSTPHRVHSRPGVDRISCPFFFDPGWDVEVQAIPGADRAGADGTWTRWDGADPREFRGTYGDYLVGKVSKVFPELRADVLDG
jgi:isopenicillin N synthase-like dioxygenase